MKTRFAVIFCAFSVSTAIADDSFPKRFTAALIHHDEPYIRTVLDGCVLRLRSTDRFDLWEQRNELADFLLDLDQASYSNMPAEDGLPAYVTVSFPLRPKLEQAEADNLQAYSKEVVKIWQNIDPPNIWRAILFPQSSFEDQSNAYRALADRVMSGEFGPVLQRNYTETDMNGDIYTFDAMSYLDLTVIGPDARLLLIELQDWQMQHCPSP
ncbi:hypothetical protein [Parasulfitobacter algicola]|uniref:Uncharacterized protein n=1 Tax=Parasulfitobacter algicola TaxID=2614809 RepID=A0ABX2IQE7_9RHOB|nr:hypothetical protein [Sulfitobacter algicola]NSX55111.1 hypothetical protein [Sulfitobacter algicola]